MQEGHPSRLAPEQQQQMLHMRQMAQTTGGSNEAFGGMSNGAFKGMPPPPGAISGAHDGNPRWRNDHCRSTSVAPNTILDVLPHMNCVALCT